MSRIAVHLDYLQAIQIIAALEQRREILRSHIETIDVPEPVLSRALVDAIAAEFAIRAAFGVTKLSQDDIDSLVAVTDDEIPLALAIYQAEGR